MRLFFNKQQIAEALGTTPGVAASLLSERGVSPVDWGPGRSRGLRWYAEAVKQVAYEIHMEAQQKQAQPKKKKLKISRLGLISGRSAAEIHAELTATSPVQ